MRYVFCLGNTPDLATTELESVLKRQGITTTLTTLLPSVIAVETLSPLSVELLELLGGTVKVAEALTELNPASDDTVIDKIIAVLKNLISEEHQRINFGLSFSSEKSISNFPDLNRWAKTIKDSLEQDGVKVRYVLPKPRELELSSVVVAKQKLTEIQILTIRGKAVLAKTIWVQNFEQWNRRDYNRPAVDPHAGMLPPKVARMMVNIALVAPANAGKCTILDPFCGVGTILAEALMVGANTIGSDVNHAQIEKTKKNLDWLTTTYNFEPNRFHLYVCDAREISQKLSPNSVDAIVTEPDLGPNTNLAPEKRTKTTLWLERLYLDSLSDWKKILRPNGQVVMVLPSFRGGFDLVKNVVDKAKIMGYSLPTKPFLYFRPQAQVRRNICVFKLVTNY